jgi:hypothetical protein
VSLAVIAVGYLLFVWALRTSSGLRDRGEVSA